MIIRQIHLFCDFFESVTFIHIPREWNRVADYLAKWASDFMEGWFIEDKGQLSPELPHMLDQLVDHDRSF